MKNLIRNNLNYDYEVAEDICKKTGLVFDENIAAIADKYFSSARLSQEQADRMLTCYSWILASIFDRKSYSFWTRIKLSLYWLGLGKRIKSYGK